VACIENRRWTYGGVTYATINIQGSCNNLCDVNPDPAEFAARATRQTSPGYKTPSLKRKRNIQQA
jgi:hypothetical protein